MFTAAEMRSVAEEKRADAAKARLWARFLCTRIHRDRMRQIADELEREADELQHQAESFARSGGNTRPVGEDA